MLLKNKFMIEMFVSANHKNGWLWIILRRFVLPDFHMLGHMNAVCIDMELKKSCFIPLKLLILYIPGLYNHVYHSLKIY